MTTQSTDTLLSHQQSWILLTIIVNMSKQKLTGYGLKIKPCDVQNSS